MAQRIALVQPIIAPGKSIGIRKSPESIQALAGQCEPLYETRMFHEKPGCELFQSLSEFQPDILGISTMTPNFPTGKAIAQEMKRLFPKVPVVLGGWHSSGCVQAYLQQQEQESLTEILNPHSPFDALVAGEGDIVFPELVRRLFLNEALKDLSGGHLSCNEAFEDLEGVGYLDQNHNIQVSVAPRIDDLDDLLDPSWKNLPIDHYRDGGDNALDLSVHSNRGCRFDCYFCSTPTVCPGRVRTLSAKRTVQYIETVLKHFRPSVIIFTDEDFFANPKWVQELVNLLFEHQFSAHYQVVFDTFASVLDIYRLIKDLQKGKLFLEKMKEAGFDSFTIGVESLCAKTLRKYNKELMIVPLMEKATQDRYHEASSEKRQSMLVTTYLRRVQRAILFAYEHGIRVVGDYIIGYPEETLEEIQQGFKMFCTFSHLFAAYLPIYTPFPGTRLWKEAYDSGKLYRDSQGYIDWARFDASTAAMKYDYDIEALRNNCELLFYSSQRYTDDMCREIQRNPKSILMFIGRFRRLAHSFPENVSVQEDLDELETLKQGLINDGLL